MKFNTGQRPDDVDELYGCLCEVLDACPAEEQAHLLARLCLLLLGELSDKDRALALLKQARQASQDA